MLASLLYPYDDDANALMDGWLAELTSEGCIARYEVQGASYIQILQWLDHQKIDKPSQSKLPEFAKPQRKLAKPREGSFTPAGKEVAEGKGREGKGEDSAEPQSDSPPAATIPLCDGTEHPVTSEQLADWQGSFPAVDVLQELREMRAWSNAHPENRKTARGVNAFITRWLGREQDKGGRVKPRNGTPTEMEGAI